MGIKEIWMEFEHAGDRRAEGWGDNDQCNVSATLDDGHRYAFNVWTYRFLETMIVDCRSSGEHMSGLYLPAPDLFVNKLDRPTIEQSLTHWLKLNGHFPDHLECTDDE